jgi:hypothetical protein
MQHFDTYPGSTFVCGADAYGRHNSRLDENPALTTCPRCQATEAWQHAAFQPGQAVTVDGRTGTVVAFQPAADSVSGQAVARVELSTYGNRAWFDVAGLTLAR